MNLVCKCENVDCISDIHPEHVVNVTCDKCVRLRDDELARLYTLIRELSSNLSILKANIIRHDEQCAELATTRLPKDIQECVYQRIKRLRDRNQTRLEH